jgi:hypothetical protein
MSAATFYQIAAKILADVAAAIAEGPTPTVSRIGVVPGEIAWDGCEDCGQLVISLTRVFLSDAFPTEASVTPQGNCASAWLCGSFTLQLIRCAPTPDERGNPPTATALDSCAYVLMTDSATIMNTVPCTLQAMQTDPTQTIEDYVVIQQLPVGPLGACVGSQLDVIVSVARDV